jgi:hypothetical protein
MGSQFFVTLPSNSSHNYYPLNTMTNFTTRLHTILDLSGSWECGISEVNYPRNWYTVQHGGGRFSLTVDVASILDRNDMLPITVDYEITPGYYEAVLDIVSEMNNQLLKPHASDAMAMIPRDQYPKFRYSKVSKKVHITVPGESYFTFSSSLVSILGIGVNQNPLDSASIKERRIDGAPTYTWKADQVSDISRGINNLFIYCDIIESTIVGDTKAPLLRIVEAKGSIGEIITRTYDDPRYIPLQKKNFDSIEIDIRDQLGAPIQFETGRVIVTLHFRRTQNPYYL